MKNNCQETRFLETAFSARKKLSSMIINRKVKIEIQVFPMFALVLNSKSQLSNKLIMKVTEIRIDVRVLNTRLRYIN